MARVISIDGPAGAGCSSLANSLEQDAGIPKVPTGLCYRGLSVALLKEGAEPENLEASVISEFAIKNIGRFALSSSGIKLDGKDITLECRQGPHHQGSSIVSEVPEVRKLFTEPLVQELVRTFDTDLAVSEGRDEYYLWRDRADNLAFGVYLTAAPEIRARRWMENPEHELMNLDDDSKYRDILVEILKRDYRDTSRELSPLLPASDALFVTPLTKNEALVDKILNQGQLFIDSGIRSKSEVLDIVIGGIDAWRQRNPS